MKKLIVITVLLAFAWNAIAQVTQERNAGNFNGIKASGTIKVIVTEAPTNTIKVVADENDQDKVITEVKNGILEVFSRKNKNTEDIAIYITAPTLNFIETSGVVELEGKNLITAEKLTVEASGSSNIKLEVKAREIKTNNSGASTIKLTGIANHLIAESSGASNLKAFKLVTDTVDVVTSGASSARVNTLTKINVSASGASSVHYTGTPTIKAIEQTGAADVSHREVSESSSTKNDTTRIRLGSSKIIIINDDKDENRPKKKNKFNSNFKHWSGFELSLNGYLNPDRRFNMAAPYKYMELNYAKSFCFGLNIWEKDIHLYRNYLNLVTGFGFDFNNYSFSNKIKLNPDTSFINGISTPDYNYNKNKLKTFFLNVPVLLEVNTGINPKRSFHIASGIILSYKLRSRTKQTYTIDGYKFEANRDAEFNLNPLRASATVRIGYGKFTVFGTMALNSLFKANQGPELYPFTAGISLITGW